MEHVVFYPALDGAPAFRRFASLDEAVRFVEHLRNAEGVSEVSVHTLAPVPLAFRAYYKVEVPQDDAPAAPVAEVAEVPVVPAPSEPVYDVPAPAAEVPAVEPEPVPALAAVEPEPVMVSPNGKKSLGFFAH
ncbi:MAG: hypothetical protein QOG34_991 [Frankiaceae bacterium]|jgi:hypothetical protein|nr:hypothetical protein [Frankiaceae bacterium]